MTRLSLLVAFTIIAKVVAWVPYAQYQGACRVLTHAKSKKEDISSGGTELAFEAEDDAQNLFAVQNEYASLSKKLSSVLRDRVGGIAVSTEGKTWVALQVALDALPPPHRACAVAMRQAAEIAPLLGLGSEGVDGDGDVTWLLTGRPSGNSKRLLGLASRYQVYQSVRSTEELEDLNAAVREAADARVSGPGAGTKRAPVSAANVRSRNVKPRVEQLDVVLHPEALGLPGASLSKDEDAAAAETEPVLTSSWPHSNLRPIGVMAATSQEAAACAKHLAAMGYPTNTLELFLPLSALDGDTDLSSEKAVTFERITFVEDRAQGSG